MERRNLLSIFLVLSLLFLISIACQQSGEIISPAEATQRYEATQAADTGDVVGEVEGAAFLVGSTAELTSEGYLVGMYKEVGARTAFSYATRGDQVTVVGSTELEGEIWYKIESTAGNGWLPESNLKEVE